MFGNSKQLEILLVEQKKLITEMISEMRALQTHMRFVMDDIDAIRNDINSIKAMLPEMMEMQQPQKHNWKVERM